MHPTPVYPHVNPRGCGFQPVLLRTAKLACLGLLALCAHLILGATAVGAEESASPRAEAGKHLFRSICARCHGEDGRGGPQRETMPAIPNFTDAKWQKSRTNVQLMISILEGKNLQMPANRGPVTDEQAPDLVAYVRTFAAPAAPKPAPATTATKTASPTTAAPTTAAPTTAAPTTAAPTSLADVTIDDTSDFAIEFNKLAKEWVDSNRQFHALASVAASKPAPVQETVVTQEPAPASVEESTPKETDRPAPVYAKPITTDDIDRGRELFMGQRRLAAGGASCIACHAVAGSSPQEGGRLGPDLTKFFERVGGRAELRGQLLTPTTPAMCALYQQHALEAEEASSLAAYLEDTDKHGVEQASGPPLNFFLMGLGGTVLGLATVSTFWKSRFGPRSRPPLNGKAGATSRSQNGLPVSDTRRAMVRTAAPAAATARLSEADVGSGL